jgi:ABC-type multidrug transport system fused ATPase/permease subunit
MYLGGGKSTIMALLLRFYDPDEGDIYLDGINIKEYNIRWLRNQFGYVGQEPVLFSGTVEENIINGKNVIINDNTNNMKLVKDFSEYMTNDDIGCFGQSGNPIKSSNTTTSTVSKNVDIDKSTYDKAETGDIELGTTNTNIENVAVSNEVVDACKLSYAHDFITTFPQGYQTDVGEGSIMIR